jgi:type I restriction enzyme S subunit
VTSVLSERISEGIPFGRAVKRRKDTGAPDLEPLSVYLEAGVVPRSTRDDNYNGLGADLSSYLIVEPGDIVFNKLRTWQGGLGVSSHRGIVSPAYFVCRPLPDFEPRFLHYLLRSSPYLAEFTRVSKFMPPSQFDILWDDLRQVLIPRMALSHQRGIADFLDTETARIDALIAKKRRMMDLLDDRATAAADRLVLGLEDSNTVASKNGYFTLVPRSWRQTSIRHLHGEVQTGPFGSQLHAEEYVEDGWPVVNPTNLKQGRIIALPGISVPDAKRDALQRHILLEGDIVFGRRGEMGRAGLVHAQHAGWVCGTGSLRLRLSPRSPLQPAYLKLLLETTALRRYFELASVGSTMDNLNTETLLGMPCLVPREHEQQRIVRSVRALRTVTEALSNRIARQVELLREHRQALITAAVSGQLEMPQVAA